MNAICVLHLSDLHWGQEGVCTHWESFEDLFVDSVKAALQSSKSQKVDLILFTGDLVFSGTSTQYAELDKKIEQLRGKLDLTCPILAVPGNHDMSRPDNKAQITEAVLKDFRSERSKFWSNYSVTLGGWFKNYDTWWKRQKHPSKILYGDIPGDFAATAEMNGLKLGVIGLNTAHLHFKDSLTEGQLGLTSPQYHSIFTQKDASGNITPREWCRSHDAVILATHHPLNWLDADSKAFFLRDVHRSGEILFHAFGHMHIPLSSGESYGGAQERFSIQAPSLFGMEHFEAPSGEKKEKRINGYSLIRIEKSGGLATFRQWPYLAVIHQGVNPAITPHSGDGGYKLLEDGGTNALPVRRLEPAKTNNSFEDLYRIKARLFAVQASVEIRNYQILMRSEAKKGFDGAEPSADRKNVLRGLLDTVCDISGNWLNSDRPIARANVMKARPWEDRYLSEDTSLRFVFGAKQYSHILTPLEVSKDKVYRCSGKGFSLPVELHSKSGALLRILPGAPRAFLQKKRVTLDCDRIDFSNSKIPNAVRSEILNEIENGDYRFLICFPVFCGGYESPAGVVNVEIMRDNDLTSNLNSHNVNTYFAELEIFLSPILNLIGGLI